MAKVTVLTIAVYHARMTREENRLFDQLVSAETLRIPGLGAQSTVMEALSNGACEVALEVREV